MVFDIRKFLLLLTVCTISAFVVKELLLKGYLSIYNIIQGIAFLYITLAIVVKLLRNGAGKLKLAVKIDVPYLYNKQLIASKH